jgi:hypothetical protein
MIKLFQAGGFPMWFILVFGLVALVAAVLFALRPETSKVAAIRALTIATLLSVGSGVASDIAAVGYAVSGNPAWAHSPELPRILLEGIGESMSPVVMGCSLLSMVWLVVALGQRRLARQLAAA